MCERLPLDHCLALEYPYTVIPDDGAFFITFPDLPGCMTQVEDPAGIGAMADEIRVLGLETTYEESDQSIPEPAIDSEYSGRFVTRVPQSLHRDLALAARREGMSLNAYVNYLLASRNVVAKLDARLGDLEDELSAPHAQHVPDDAGQDDLPTRKAG